LFDTLRHIPWNFESGGAMIPNYKYKPRVYFIATFIATYSFWLAGAYASFQDEKSGMYMLFMLPGLMQLHI
jgi:hypothetical protein